MKISNPPQLAIGLFLGLASIITSTTATAAIPSSESVTYGYEVGIEDQLERIDGNNFARRTPLRLQGTVDWQAYKDKQGSSFDVHAKGGAILGRYKGSSYGEYNYGSLIKAWGGVTGEVAGVYTYNAGVVDPIIGLSVDLEVADRLRAEWQSDAIVGLKLKVDDDKSLTVRYQKSLIHGVEYIIDDRSYRQDDGYGVALIGTKYMTDGTSRSVKIEYEHFNKSDIKQHDNGMFGYEPDAANWLVSYQKTF